MCGRFTLNAPARDVARLFDLARIPELAPRYNIAPTQGVAAVREAAQVAGRELVELRWGLVPFWAESPRGAARMINARWETASTQPAFRAAFAKRRCLIPASGFYEWQRRGGRKQPFYVCRRDRAPFAFAGLWERWDKGEEPIESCTVLTTEANEVVRPVHDRMPVIVRPEDFERWLDLGQNAGTLERILRPSAGEEMTAYPVGVLVNSARNDDAKLIEPVATGLLFD